METTSSLSTQNSNDPQVLTVPSHDKCDGVQSTFMVEKVAELRDREGAAAAHPSVPDDHFVAHNPGSNHQVSVWAFGSTAVAAHNALVERLAAHPAKVRLVDGGDHRHHAECQAEWEEAIR